MNVIISKYILSLKVKGVLIIEKDVKIDVNGDSWVVNGEFLVQEPAGISVAIDRTETATPEAEQTEPAE